MTGTETTISGEVGCPRATEVVAACLLALSFLLFHVATYNLYPVSWCDEVTYSEPGINLAEGRGLTTSVWQLQPAGTFWAVNPPLHPVVLSAWVKVFGSSLLAVRSFNFCLFTACALLLWFLSWRFRLVHSMWLRLALIVLAECGFGVSLAFRSARPDVLPMLALLLMAATISLRSVGWKCALLFAISSCTPGMGLQIALYVAILAAMGWLLWHVISFKEVAACAAGILCGTCLLLAVLVANDAIDHFQLSVDAVARVGGLGRLGSALVSYFKDFSALALIAGGACMLVLADSPIHPRARKVLTGVLTVYFGVPIIFCLLADFRSYYAYMLYFPLLLGFGHLASQVTGGRGMKRSIPLQLVSGATIVVACFAGLPLRLSITAAFADLTSRRDLATVISSHVQPSDVAYTEYMTFFEVKGITPHVYVPFSAKGLGPISIQGRELTDQEKSSVDVVIVRPDAVETVTSYFGGTWTATTRPFGDTVEIPAWIQGRGLDGLLRTFFGRAPTGRYSVQVFRREPSDAARKSAD